jgi:hypothetical protein
METLFNSIGLSFLLLALVTMALIFREAFPHIHHDDRTTFQRWWGRPVRLKSRAIENVWKEHFRLFPKSRKRALFISAFLASAAFIMGYQLWLIFGAK